MMQHSVTSCSHGAEGRTATISPADSPAPILLVSHCVPDRRAQQEHRRVWDLLGAASELRPIWLLAAADQPVHLGQWRSFAACTQRLELLPAGPSWRRNARLASTLRAWQQLTRFHAIICTAPDLTLVTAEADAPLHLLDAGEQTDLAVPPPSSALWRPWQLWQNAHARAARRHAEALCDAVLRGPISHPALARLLDVPPLSVAA